LVFPVERSERNQMGSARQPVGVLFRRHDLKNLVDETRHVRARFTGALQRNLHDQVVADRSRYAKSQHEPDSGLGQFRFDRPVVGRGTRRLYAHPHQAHGARLFGRI